jgi:hypothetical protein
MRIRLLFILILVISIASCSKNPIVIKDAASYSDVYMPQAVQNPYTVNAFVVDSVLSYPVSAFYGGSVAPDKAINVTFSVNPALVDSFNLANGTAYSVLPDSFYQLDKTTAIIPAGSFSSDLIDVKIITTEDFPAFTPFLLPVTISTSDAKLNETLETIYYLITASYAPGKIPRERLFQLPSDYFSIFQFNDGIIEVTSGGSLLRFPYDENTNEFGGVIDLYGGSAGFTIFKEMFPYYSYFIGFMSNGQLWSYSSPKNPVNGWSEIVGNGMFNSGYNIFDTIIPFEGSMLCRNPANNDQITKYDFDKDLNYIGSVPPPSLGPGWNFKDIFDYKGTLICIDGSGDMYQYTLGANVNGVISTSRKKVGSGWDMYKTVFAFNDDLIAVDSDNVCWRYNFDPRGFWALK